MFHGGTNFGFTNGGLTVARGWYTADVTRQGKFFFRKLLVFPIQSINSSAFYKMICCIILIPLRFRKAGRVLCGGARETH